jgi:ribosomal protein S18 acetylase RimI-like enzyme
VADRGLRAHGQPEELTGARARLRRARAGDVAGIVAIMSAYYAEDGYPFESRRAARVLRAFLRRPDWGRAWIVSVARWPRSGIAGYAVVTLGYSLEHGGRDAFLDEIVVSPQLRGLGLGRRLLREAEAYCRRQGVGSLHLEVERRHRGAIALYRKAGFASTRRMLMTRRLRRSP